LPHPSPLNIKWFKDNPDFMKKRIIEIRKIINNTLNKE
jgi:uracil-DNA glycosylase